MNSLSIVLLKLNERAFKQIGLKYLLFKIDEGRRISQIST